MLASDGAVYLILCQEKGSGTKMLKDLILCFNFCLSDGALFYTWCVKCVRFAMFCRII